MSWLGKLKFMLGQAFLSIIARRLRNLPMLLVLVGLFALMSIKANWVLGAPYLFWHDYWLTLVLSLAAVGFFLEEWAFVGILLDTDENNPINAQRPNSEGSAISLIANVKTFLTKNSNHIERASSDAEQSDTDSEVPASEVEDVEVTSPQNIFALVREIHTWTTFVLVFLFSIASLLVYQYFNEKLSWFAVGYILIPAVSAQIVFWVRVQILKRESKISPLLVRIDRTVNRIPFFGRMVSDSTFAKVNDSSGTFRTFHLIAMVKNGLAISILALFAVCFWFKVRVPFVPSVAAIVCVLLSGFVGIYGWIVFQKSRLKYETLTVIFLVVDFVGFWFGAKNIPKEARLALPANSVLPFDHESALKKVADAVVDQKIARANWLGEKENKTNNAIAKNNDSSNEKNESVDTHEPPIRTEKRSLTNWKTKATASMRAASNQNAARDKKPILVLVSNTGGGIKAQVWSTVVLNAIERKLRDESNINFGQHVRLVSGASGGMVGAGYWVATLTPNGDHEVLVSKDENGNVKKEPITTEQMIDRMSRDCLSFVARQGFYNDILGLPLRILGVKLPTRGEALEDALIEFGPSFDIPFKQLADGENEGWRPTLIYTPSSALDGRQFLICNQPLEYLYHSTLDGDPNSIDPDDSQSGSIYSWRLNYPSSQMKLATAARLSGNFPVFVDSPYLPYKVKKIDNVKNERTRIMDAGYIDNHGVYPLASWLRANKEWVIKETGGVLLVEISAARLPRNVNLSPKGGAVPEAFGFVNSSFNKTLFHADRILGGLEKEFAELEPSETETDKSKQKLPKDFFKLITFQYQDEASLTWYLSSVEKFSLIYPFLSDQQLESLQSKKTFNYAKTKLPTVIQFKTDIKDSALISGVDRFDFLKRDPDPRVSIAKKLNELVKWWKAH